MISILQLRYFSVIAYYQNLSRAAQELMVSQPSLSKMISSLECELNTPLFIRDGKKLTLSPAGDAFLRTANAIINLLDESLNSFKIQHELTGELRIAYRITCHEFYQDCMAFTTAYPNVTIKLYSGEKFRGDPFRSGFELALLPDYDIPACPHIILGKRHTLYAVFSNNHPLSTKESISLIDLKNEYFAFLSPSIGKLDHTYQLCIESGFTPKIRYVADSLGALQQFILTGNAIFLTYNNTCKPFHGRNDLVLVRITGNYALGRETGLCLLSNSPSPLAMRYWEFIYKMHKKYPCNKNEL